MKGPDTMTRLATRGIATAQAIAERKPFTTSGALSGIAGTQGSGRLNTVEMTAFYHDVRVGIDYAVYSYATPIAWHTVNGWHKVAQRFSVTTSRHQGNLYLIESAS